MSESHYDDDLTVLFEAIWGPGFMSPGGTDEVDRILSGVSVAGMAVLDIGSGLGGVDFHLVEHHGAGKVVGIDVEPALVDRCQQRAVSRGLADRLEFRCVEPGSIPLPDASFDIVTSKDSIIHITDKAALAADVFRLLKPGGAFVAGDWLAGYEGDAPQEMQTYVEAEGLGFALASADAYRDALVAAGFVDVEIVDRNEWYHAEARGELEQLGGPLRNQLVREIGEELVAEQIDVWEKMLIALDLGYLRPTHFRAHKPA